jgi:hypothetical protein
VHDVWVVQLAQEVDFLQASVTLLGRQIKDLYGSMCRFSDIASCTHAVGAPAKYEGVLLLKVLIDCLVYMLLVLMPRSKEVTAFASRHMLLN